MQLDKNNLGVSLKGTLIFPEDSEYEKARTLFYGGMDKKPAVIVRVSDQDDIKNALSLAKIKGLEVTVRSGGHSLAGHSVIDGGIVIDLRNMKKLEINASDKTAWAEAGLTAGEYTRQADTQGLVTGFGDTGSVGIGGITLGGGVGFLVRKYGLTIDNLLAAEIVTADGQLLRIDDKNHLDLFWAIRGGGGNFGVVTRFQFRLHALPSAYGGMLILPAEPDVIAGFLTEAEKAPDELSTIINIMPAPPMPFLPRELHGKLIVMALMLYAGESNAGEKVVAPFRALAKPLADMVRPMRYPEIFFPDDDSFHPTAVSRTMFTNAVDRTLAETILKDLAASDAPMQVVQLRVLGGAVSRVAEDATAYAHRKSRIMANVAAFYQTPEEKQQRIAWVEALAQKMYQGDNGVYIGFLDGDREDRIHNAYPAATWEKLSAIKQKYDPENLFRHNHTILPNA